MINQINENLNNYLEFDNNELYVDNLVRVFGGAIRDSIAGDPIHDIDIMCGSKSVPILESILESHGYVYMEQMITKDITSLYSDISVISEPHTWVKKNKIVQIIRPAVPMARQTEIILNREEEKENMEMYEENFIQLIQNVDLSCCGVSYAKGILYENCKNAISHCVNKFFVVNENARMYTKRIYHRIGKLEQRGWQKVMKSDVDMFERDVKISLIMNNVTYEYNPEYKKSIFS